MRTLLCQLSLIIFAANLSASQQSFVVTPQTLNEWTLVGVEKTNIVDQCLLTLPASSQLSRTFPCEGLALQITTRPTLSDNAEDWPVVELGSNALVFTRNGLDGKLLFVSKNNTPVVLPFSYALDEAGQSVEPLVFSFSQQGSMVNITISGQTLQYPVATTSNSTLEVIFSAGTHQAWSFENLAITVNYRTAAASPSSENTNATTAANTESTAPENSSATAAPSSPSTVTASASQSGPAHSATTSITKTKPKAFAMEIFTPPSVRHGRADSIRATIQGKTKK